MVDHSGDRLTLVDAADRTVNMLADIFDTTVNWSWGCGVATHGHVTHSQYEEIIEDNPETGDEYPRLFDEESGIRWIGIQEFGDERFHILNGGEPTVDQELDALFPDDDLRFSPRLPDFAQPFLLPEVLDDSTGKSFSRPNELASEIRLFMATRPFKHTHRQQWLDEVGPDFQKMVTGDFGEGYQHLSFDVNEITRYIQDPKAVSPMLTRDGGMLVNADMDSAMGWLPSLDVISTDITFHLYPFSNRNLDSNVHLFLEVSGKNVPLHHIHHFPIAIFGGGERVSCLLYVFLPNYNRGGDTNLVMQDVQDRFISTCLMRAATDVLPSAFHLSWSQSFAAEQLKCNAPRFVGAVNASMGSRLARGSRLPKQYVQSFWARAMELLELEWNAGHLHEMKGFRLFWDTKGTKNIVVADDFESLATPIRERVSVQRVNAIDHRSTACSICI